MEGGVEQSELSESGALLLSGCAFLLENTLTPINSLSDDIYTFLQYNVDPISIVEFLAYHVPRRAKYNTFLFKCDGNTIQAGLEAVLGAIRRLDEDLRKSPPRELLVDVVRSLYDQSVDLADTFYRHFAYISSRVPLSLSLRVAWCKIPVKVLAVSPSASELLKLVRGPAAPRDEATTEPVDKVIWRLAKSLAEDDVEPEVPSLARCLRSLAGRYGLVDVDASARTITVIGVKLQPPTEASFERVVDALGLHLRYYGTAQTTSVKYRYRFLWRKKLTVNVLHSGDGIRVLVPPSSLAHMLSEKVVNPSAYLLIKTTKVEQDVVADVYLLHIFQNNVVDSAKVLRVSMTRCNDDVDCVVREVGKRAGSSKRLVIIYRLLRELQNRGYNVRLVHTKEYNCASKSYEDVVEVRATKQDFSSGVLYSVFYVGGKLAGVVNDVSYDIMLWDIDRIEECALKLAFGDTALAQESLRILKLEGLVSVRESLHGAEVSVRLYEPDDVVEAVDFLERFFRLYVERAVRLRQLVTSLSRKEAILMCLAAISSAYYTPHDRISSAYADIEKRAGIPGLLLHEICNDYLSTVGEQITRRDAYADADRVLYKLFTAGSVELDGDSFKVLGLRFDHVAKKYGLSIDQSYIDMYVLRALLKRFGLREITGDAVPVRIVELLLAPRFSVSDDDRRIQLNALLDVVSDERTWRELPEEYRLRAIEVGGRELVVRAAAEGYTWVLDGEYLDRVLRLLETPSERTAVLARALGYDVYTYKGQHYIKRGSVLLQVCQVGENRLVFRGSTVGYPIGIAFVARDVTEAIKYVVENLSDAYLEFTELLEELKERGNLPLRVSYEDVGAFKVPVFEVGDAKLYLDKGVIGRLRELVKAQQKSA